MRKRLLTTIIIFTVAIISLASRDNGTATYSNYYNEKLDAFARQQEALLASINAADIHTEKGIEQVKQQIQLTRNKLKGMDFWFRYLEPTMYKKLNGPLPVEWETEVFEKFEKPYKRSGAGLTLAALYLDEEHSNKDTLASLVRQSIGAIATYRADSITKNLTSYHHFFLCNRLFILNLAAIYTTGFECPDTAQIIPELRIMLGETKNIYAAFNESFPTTKVSEAYLSLFNKTIAFVNAQPAAYTSFDHFTFIRDYVNPLFVLNQQMIRDYKVVSHSLIDYSLNKQATSIFKKDIYNGQNAKGLFLRVDDTAVLAEIEKIGKLLFYDPILSGNNLRSCASCHKPTEYFTDTAFVASLQYNGTDRLRRNSPSLLNAQYNHLVMLDGKHYTLQHQVKAVVSNPEEMNCDEKELLKKVMSCGQYAKAFKKFLQYTPQETKVTIDHIASALTIYYTKFSRYYSPFDDAMNNHTDVPVAAQQGFNLFMSKAQCATCHFVPQFNGVKPPFVGSEFEVLGVPEHKDYKQLSADKGRYEVNPADETLNAFRTGSVRNAAHTTPYMHNGVFTTMEEVIDFYDAGGGAGHGLRVGNQTLSSDSLHLSQNEKAQLLQFITALNEQISFENPPVKLPKSTIKSLNSRKVGGTY
jgi:cytochrome c peroxidase